MRQTPQSTEELVRGKSTSISYSGTRIHIPIEPFMAPMQVGKIGFHKRAATPSKGGDVASEFIRLAMAVLATRSGSSTSITTN
mmetsp:Transcript_20071/g.29780  ORF Transcript_20071/g.29780 Transcript_20071/m.29780 type:complete len:83 (+) Transcript_20071:414-662(+)